MELRARSLCALAIASACADAPPGTSRTTQADTPAIDFAADARRRTPVADLPLRGFTLWNSRVHRRADFLAAARPAMQLAEASTLEQTKVLDGAGQLDQDRKVYRYRCGHHDHPDPRPVVRSLGL
jgi:hypothetical protein